MFEMDYFLFWLFVVVLNIEKFEIVVCEKKIFIDVVFVGINNFIKINFIFKFDKIELRNKMKNKREKIRKVKILICFLKSKFYNKKCIFWDG